MQSPVNTPLTPSAAIASPIELIIPYSSVFSCRFRRGRALHRGPKHHRERRPCSRCRDWSSREKTFFVQSVTKCDNVTQVGSIATMDACVRRYAAATGLPLPAAAACASAAAARLLGLEGKKGSLCAGCDADLVVLDGQGQVTATIAVIIIIITVS
jgi:hypothetical protein